MTTLLMDLGGTRLKAGVVTDGSAIVRRDVADVPEDHSKESLLKLIATTGWNILSGAKPDSVALCIPGLVDDGILVSLPGKLDGLVGEDLTSFLRSEFHAAHATVSHDGVAYATGESAAGAGKGVRRCVVVTIGTGVGVGVMQDGQPISRGMFGAGILGGFIPLSEATDGPADSTEQTDTIEALCASQRIVDLAGSSYGSVADVYAAHARGEFAARAAVDHYRVRLSRALIALAHAHAPDRIVLGGGAMQAGNPIVDGLEELVNARLFGTYRVEVRLAELGDDAALIGLLHLLKGAR
jgi:glucokinase